MKFAFVDGSFAYEHDEVSEISFKSETTFLDYDFLLWDPNSILDQYKTSETYMGYPALNDDNSTHIVEDIQRRREEMKAMLELGRSIVIFTPAPQTCYVATGERQYSGTGRNRQVTRIVDELNILSAIPIPRIQTHAATGRSLEIRSDGPFATFWQRTKNYLEYKSYFKDSLGKPFLFVKGTQLAVGTHLKIGNGNLIFIPSFALLEGADEEKADEEFQAENDFIAALTNLLEELKQDTGDFSLPDWSKGYILPNEREMESTLIILEKKLEEILTQVSRQKNEIAEVEKNKILITGSGRALEVQVKKILEELGFTATEGLPGRDDLILEYGGKIAVVEIRGVSKSGAEKHAAL